MAYNKAFSRKDIKLLKRSLTYAKQYKFKLFILFIAINIIIILGIIQPLIWGKILQDVTEGKYNKILFNLSYLLVIYLLQAIITLIKGYSETLLNNNIIYDLKSEMYLKILNLSMNVFDKMKTGEFISRLQGDVFTLANIITNQFITAIVNLLKVIILGITIFKIDVILSLIVLSGFPITYVLFLVFGKKLRVENKEFAKINDSYFSILQQSLSGIKHIKTSGLKKNNFKIFSDNSTQLKNKQVRISLLQAVAQTVSMIVSSFNDVVLIGVSIYFISSGKLSIQYLIAFVAYSSQFSQSLKMLTQLNSSIQQVLVSLERIFSLIDNLGFSNEVFGDKEIKEIKGEIEFRKVSFSYDKENKILKEVSFIIKPGNMIAIVGRNGCGKTTILNLLAALYKCDDGKIFIDGINIQDFNENSLRNNISIIHQQPFIFSLSIIDNFKLNCPNITKNEIEEVCKKVLMHEHIMSLKNGYDTQIEENANNLSGGQKQRLALAICLCKNTPVILLDEATAALDIQSKAIIDTIIKEISKSRTVIMVTHSISTMINANEIIIIDDGEVIGQGSHNLLINDNIEYAKLYKHEFISFEEVSAEVESYEN